MCMQFPLSSAVKFFALCTKNQTFSLSCRLLSVALGSCRSSCLAYLNFFRFLIMSSVFSAESSVMHVIRYIAKSGLFIN